MDRNESGLFFFFFFLFLTWKRLVVKRGIFGEQISFVYKESGICQLHILPSGFSRNSMAIISFFFLIEVGK